MMMACLIDRTLRLFGTREEVARFLGIHPTAVSHWVNREGVIPPLRVSQLRAEAEKRGLGQHFEYEALMELVRARTAQDLERRRGRWRQTS